MGRKRVTGTSKRAEPTRAKRCGVRRFTEKPDAKKADEFVNAGNYYWSSGMFLWSARTLADP